MILRARMFDALVADFHIGDGSGLDALTLASEYQPKAFRILYTATADAPIIEEAKRSGLVQRFFQKPVAAEAIKAALREGLQDRKRLGREPGL